MSFGIKVENTNRVQVLLGNMRVSTKKINDQLAADFAQYVYNTLMQNIKTNFFRFQPLNPVYLRWKLRNGRSEKIFISTAQYVNSIQCRQVGGVWSVIVPNTMFHGTGGPTMRDLALILENGSVLRHIPPRPLWAKTNAQCRAQYNSFSKAYLNKIQASMDKSFNFVTTGFSQGHSVNNG